MQTFSIDPSHPAYRAFLKLDRGRKQLLAFRKEAEAVANKLAQTSIRVELDTKTGDRVCRYVAPDLPPEWSVVIGEIVHNFRSALDNIVWQLVIHDKGNPSARTGFPICRKPQDFAAARGSKLAGVSARAIAAIEGMQPYHAAEPHLHGLYVLSELWNIDKHRTVHVCAMTATLVSHRVEGFDHTPPDLFLRAPGPLESGDVVSIIPAQYIRDIAHSNKEKAIVSEVVFELAVGEMPTIPLAPGDRDIFYLLGGARENSMHCASILNAMFE
jgi:hypothetical protein